MSKNANATNTSENKGRVSSRNSPTQRSSRPSIDRKKARFDEDNIRDTLHPEGKDYGHMKIEEPKTPYNWIDPNKSTPGTSVGNVESQRGVDAGALQKKLQEEIKSTSNEAKKKKEFEERRRAHYDEYLTLKARKESGNLEGDDEESIDSEFPRDKEKRTPSKEKLRESPSNKSNRSTNSKGGDGNSKSKGRDNKARKLK